MANRYFYVPISGGGFALLAQTDNHFAALALGTRHGGERVEIVELQSSTAQGALLRLARESVNPVGWTPDEAISRAHVLFGAADEVTLYDPAAAGGALPAAPVVLPDLDARPAAAPQGAPTERPAHLPAWLAWTPGMAVAEPENVVRNDAIPAWLADPSKPTASHTDALHQTSSPAVVTDPSIVGAGAHAAGLASGIATPSGVLLSQLPMIPAEHLPPEVQAALAAQREAIAGATESIRAEGE